MRGEWKALETLGPIRSGSRKPIQGASLVRFDLVTPVVADGDAKNFITRPCVEFIRHQQSQSKEF